MSFIQPQSITPEEFLTYSRAWKTLVNGPDADSLGQYFASSSGLINYVYLPAEMAVELLTGNPASIALEFALVPDGETFAFTMLLAGVYGDTHQPMAPFFQAGVAGRAALNIAPDDTKVPELVDAGDNVIPYADAKNWVVRWNNLEAEKLGTLQFDTAYSERLCGYDYPTSDLYDALHSAELPNPALWFNFALHEATPLFGTVLNLNSCPTPTDPGTIILSPARLYYDVSKPCPPFHIADPITTQQ